MITKMIAKLQRREGIVRRQEEERLEHWMRSRSTEEVMRYVMDEMRGELELLKTLSNEQLIRVPWGTSFLGARAIEKTSMTI